MLELREVEAVCVADKYKNGVNIKTEYPESEKQIVSKDPTLSNKLTLSKSAVVHPSRSHLQMTNGHLPEIAGLLGLNEYRRCVSCGCQKCLCHAFVLRHRVVQAKEGQRQYPVRRAQWVVDAYRRQLGNFYRDVTKVSHDLKPIPLRQIPLRYSGAKRLAAERTVKRLGEIGGLTGRLGFDPFVKNERADPNSKEKPRMIVPQMMIDPETGAKTNAPVLVELTVGAPLETALERMTNPDGSRLFASGMTPQERAAWIEAKCSPDRRLFFIDMKAFDGSQGNLAIDERYAFIKHLKSRGIDTTEVNKVLMAQNRIKFSTKGLKGNIAGNRASGTGRTSSANKVVMMCALRFAFNNNPDVEYLCDGDDTLIVMPARYSRHRLRNAFRRLALLGLETTLDGTATASHEATFCRAKIVKKPEGPELVKVPADAFQSASAIIRHFRGNELPAYLSTLNIGYTNLWAGVPVLCAIGSMFPLGSGVYKPELLDGSGVEYLVKGIENTTDSKLPSVTQMARTSFEETFGIPIAHQLRIEHLMRETGKQMPAALNAWQLARKPG